MVDDIDAKAIQALGPDAELREDEEALLSRREHLRDKAALVIVTSEEWATIRSLFHL